MVTTKRIPRVLAACLIAGFAVTLSSCGGGATCALGAIGCSKSSPPSDKNSAISANPAQILLSTISANTSTVTVQLNDSNGNPITTGGATVVISSNLGTVTPSPANDNGNGTYSAQFISSQPGVATLSFTVNGTAASNTATVTVITVANAAYFIPYTTQVTTSPSTPGLWLVNAANPQSAPSQVTSAALDVPVFQSNLSSFGLPTFFNWTYNSATQKATALQPAFEVYGSGGHFFGVSLQANSTSPLSPPVPVQVSSGTYASLCSMYPIQTGSYSAGTPSFVIATVDTVANDNCVTNADEVTWLIPTTATSSTAPTVFSNTIAGYLVDPNTGNVSGVLIYTGSELDLYSPGFQFQQSLLTAQTANFAFALGQVNGGALIDLETYHGINGTTPGTSNESLYIVTSSSANLVATYSITSSAPEFTGATACSSNNNFGSFIFGTTVGNSFVYTYPNASGGFNLYTYSASTTAPTVALTSATSDCMNGIDGDAPGYAVLNTHDVVSGNTEDVSYALAGPATQTGIVLATQSATKNESVHYIAGNDAWIDVKDTTPQSESVVNLTTGAVVQTFSSSVIIGDQWGGYANDGSVIRSTVLLGALSSSSSGCTAPSSAITAVTSVDTTTLAQTSFSAPAGTSYCEQSIFFGPGPSEIGVVGGSLASLALTSSSLQFYTGVASAPANPASTPFVNLLSDYIPYFGY